MPGARTVSNHPEVFGTTEPESGETAAEQARENRSARRLLTPRLGYSVQRIPDVGRMRVHERTVRVGDLSVVVGAGEPLVTVERAQHGVARAFALAGALTLFLALLASYLAGARVTAPLRRMAGGRPACRCRRSGAADGAADRAAATRCWCSPRRSTTCSTGSRRRSAASENSSPTPHTSCARR